ncbi:hypothetical protein [Modicisalibacter coralii]|uniref:hypothetical protein n=1 Tax=Modicisalibacter coralii TaxID=2304602 RepID=UPI00100BC9A4|nr:hypothetical protein [Halomonas coralii]
MSLLHKSDRPIGAIKAAPIIDGDDHDEKPKQRQWIVMCWQDICDQAGIQLSTFSRRRESGMSVYDALRKPVKHKRHFDDWEISKALRMRHQGYTWPEVAQELGRYQNVIQARIRTLRQTGRLPG